MAPHPHHEAGAGHRALTEPLAGVARLGPPDRLGPRALAGLAALALLLLLPGRFALPPLDRDESRYLEATSQMLNTGNYVDVRFQDQPRYLQPAGIYWLEAIAVGATDALAGSDAPRRAAWPYRIPSLLAGVADVLLTASIGAALFGRRAGVLAGVALAVSVLFAVEGRIATIDATLLVAVLVAERALLAVFRAHRAGVPTGPGPGLAFWIAVGCGLMLKGPVIGIPAFGTLAALSALERTGGLWRRLRPARGIPVALAIVLPWLVAIVVVSHGRFLADAVGTNLLGKVAHGQQAHGAPPGTYAAIFLAAFWPGSLFAVLAIPFAWRTRREWSTRFALAALVPHWVVFELIATKLPHYVLPAYPAVAWLTAGALTHPAVPVGRPVRAFGIIYGALWLVAGLAVAGAGPVLLWRLAGTTPPQPIIGAVAVAALLVAATHLLRRDHRVPAFAAAAAAAALLTATLFGAVVPRLDVLWLSPRIAAMVRQVRPCPDSVVASTSFSEPSLVFSLGRDTKLLPPDAAARFLANDRACGLALVGARDMAAFRAALTVPVRRLATIDGINYSTGRRLHLALLTAATRS